jgi:hypothetical protein
VCILKSVQECTNLKKFRTRMARDPSFAGSVGYIHHLFSLLRFREEKGVYIEIGTRVHKFKKIQDPNGPGPQLCRGVYVQIGTRPTKFKKNSGSEWPGTPALQVLSDIYGVAFIQM